MAQWNIWKRYTALYSQTVETDRCGFNIVQSKSMFIILVLYYSATPILWRCLTDLLGIIVHKTNMSLWSIITTHKKWTAISSGSLRCLPLHHYPSLQVISFFFSDETLHSNHPSIRILGTVPLVSCTENQNKKKKIMKVCENLISH